MQTIVKIWALGMFDIHIYLAVKIRPWGPPAGIFLITVHHIITSQMFFSDDLAESRKGLKTRKMICLFLLKRNAHKSVTGKRQVFYYCPLLQWRWGILFILNFTVGHISSSLPNLPESWNCSRHFPFYARILENTAAPLLNKYLGKLNSINTARPPTVWYTSCSCWEAGYQLLLELL